MVHTHYLWFETRARQEIIDITDEVVERMNIKLHLLTDGMGAVSFFREELERSARAASISGVHNGFLPNRPS